MLSYKWTFGLIVAAVATAGSAAESEYLKCDRGQRLCVVENEDLTIGDKVGFFNHLDQLVAVGVVKKMHGDRRAIDVRKKYAVIRYGHYVTLMNAKAFDDRDIQVYRVYRDPPKKSYGANFGITKPDIGEPKLSWEATGYYQWDRKGPFDLIGRGTLFTVNSEVSRSHDEEDLQTLPLEVYGVGGMAGGAFTAFYGYPVRVRAELVGGLTYLSGDVGGDVNLVEDSEFDTHIKNGFGLMARGELSFLKDWKDWYTGLFVGHSLYHNASHTTLGLGVSFDLR